MDIEQLRQEIKERAEGVLTGGSHSVGYRMCAHEFENAVRGLGWTSVPAKMPDLRALNDASWSSDSVRTEALLPVMAALWDWETWSTERQWKWGQIVADKTLQQTIPALPAFPEWIRERLQASTEARLPSNINWVGLTSIGVAGAAQWAATWLADAMLKQTCQFWIDAVQESGA